MFHYINRKKGKFPLGKKKTQQTNKVGGDPSQPLFFPEPP